MAEGGRIVSEERGSSMVEMIGVIGVLGVLAASVWTLIIRRAPVFGSVRGFCSCKVWKKACRGFMPVPEIMMV